jgi:transposase
VADRFCVGRATVDRWLSRYRETGSVAPLPHGGGPSRKLDEERRGQLPAAVEEKPNATREELREKLLGSGKLDVSV